MNEKKENNPSAMAEETLTGAEKSTKALAPPEITLQEKEKPQGKDRVRELTQLRTEHSKVFRLADGREQAVYYASPIHELDEETGVYHEVDNTLKEEADGRHYISKKKGFTARFSKDEETDELFSLEKGECRVTVLMGKEAEEKNAGEKKNKGRKPKAEKKQRSGKKNTDIVTYADAETGIAYEYQTEAGGVKENIIIPKKADTYRYTFLLDCEKVEPKLNEKGNRIAFLHKDTKEEIFYIPAPYIKDANGELSTDVAYELKEEAEGRVRLTVTADRTWMNAAGRAFPVVLDPQICLNSNPDLITYSWEDNQMSQSVYHVNPVGCIRAETEEGETSTEDPVYYMGRTYVKFRMPTLPCNPRIQKAEIRFYQGYRKGTSETAPKIGLYQVLQEFTENSSGSLQRNQNILDYAVMQTGAKKEDGTIELVTYTFDITNLIDQVAAGETAYTQLVLKQIEESLDHEDYIVLYAASSTEHPPEILITYDTSHNTGSTYRSHTHELGRFGQGSIDLWSGNLMFESEDFAWSGNRMPVSIRHLYNSALADYQYTENSTIRLQTADFSAMKLGKGFRLNLLQSMKPASFYHDGETHEGYVYTDENAAEVYFKGSGNAITCADGSECYCLYKDVDGGSMEYDPAACTLKQGDTTYQFDAAGKLISITDADNNCMAIHYTANQITSVTDGAGRIFTLGYDATGHLTTLTAPDNSQITYAYTGELLTTVTYPDGRKAELTYTGNYPASVVLKDAGGAAVYKVAYTFANGRLASAAEYGVKDGVFTEGPSSAYTYSAASSRTVVETSEILETDEGDCQINKIKTVYSFNDDGSISGEYMYSEDTGNVAVEGGGSGIHPYAGDGGAKVASNINNLLKGHSFTSLTDWAGMAGNEENFKVNLVSWETRALYGKHSLSMESAKGAATANGVYQESMTLPAGEYTFSAYVKVNKAFTSENTLQKGAYVRVTDTNGTLLAESERLTEKTWEYVRLMAPFHLDSAKSVRVQILMDGAGGIYADAAQLEDHGFVSEYNLLEDGNFERETSAWKTLGDTNVVTDECFNMSRSMKLYNNEAMSTQTMAYQDVEVKSSKTTRETFVLSGWAKGYAVPPNDREGVEDARFRLYAGIKYKGEEEITEIHSADFAPNVEEWQFRSVEFAKGEAKEVEYIRICCDYSYNFHLAYFDDIQLIRTGLETDLEESDFTYTGSRSGEDMSETTTESDVEAEEEEDTLAAFEEAKDEYGNALTETTFTDGEFGTIYRSFGYDADGNNLITETDARGNETRYTVDPVTSRNQQVIDRCGNKTAYEYDSAGRTTKVTSKNAQDVELAHVSYSYDAFDQLSEIVRGDGLKYVLTYNAFHKLEAIGVDGKEEKLTTYTYKEGNGRLKELTYANGHTMKATYNRIGQLVAEKWYDAAQNGNEIAHYKYVYDGSGNIVRSIDFGAEKEYTYTYENGVLVRAAEYDITFNDSEIVTGKVLADSVHYVYDQNGKLAKKRIFTGGEEVRTLYYETSGDNETILRMKTGERTVLFHGKTDSFGRREFDELQLNGTGTISRSFAYHEGEVTDEHKENQKKKSSPQTQLVSRITFADGRTLSYEYDNEERITRVVDSLGETTEYTYDALGQLTKELVNGEEINTMAYDNYGNITGKNGIAYTYGNSQWKDLLTGYGSQTIAYDAQGNPTSYLGHTLTWEKGRQLKSFDSCTYTYNANGIRTGKTVNGVEHIYMLDGSKILRELWGANELMPIYDNADSVSGIIYNGASYYFQKNLQGDVIEVVDEEAEVVARYSYDAWGKVTGVKDKNGDAITSPTHVANINPFRYRGYYFDTEIGLYYLQSRYYDPVVGRFVNADRAEFALISNTVLRHNLFTYCANNSIMHVDYNGHEPLTLGIGVILSVALLTIALSYLVYILLEKIFELILYIGNQIGSAVQTLEEAITRAIEKAITKAATRKINRHHIIAKWAWRAKTARDIWKNNLGLLIDDSRNLVDINVNLHLFLHTKKYYESVNEMVEDAYATEGYEGVLAVVASVKTALELASSIVCLIIEGIY